MDKQKNVPLGKEAVTRYVVVNVKYVSVRKHLAGRVQQAIRGTCRRHSLASYYCVGTRIVEQGGRR